MGDPPDGQPHDNSHDQHGTEHDNPRPPPASLFPIPTTTPYGTRVVVDWHNETTGASGSSVSEEEALKGKPGIPVNRTWTGTGTVNFTVTAQTGGGWWFVNTQPAVCQGTIEVVPA